MPTAVAKCFGQKNFTAIYGFVYLVNVSKHIKDQSNIFNDKCSFKMYKIPSTFLIALLGTHGDSIGWFWLFITGSFLTMIGKYAVLYNV